MNICCYTQFLPVEVFTLQVQGLGFRWIPVPTGRLSLQAPPLASKGTSPHCLFLDEPPMNNWEDDSSPPETPDMDIPSYFTEEFQLKREQQGLPRCTAYQGPMEEAVSEDPLPPYMSAEIPIWGVIPQSEPLVNFDLLEYMNNLCQNITPPQTSN